MTPRVAPENAVSTGDSRLNTARCRSGHPAARVDLVADRGEVDDHQAHEEESALVDVDGERHRLADPASRLVSQG